MPYDASSLVNWPADPMSLLDEESRALVEQWRLLGAEPIPLSQGITITKLDRFLLSRPSDEAIESVQMFLIEAISNE